MSFPLSPLHDDTHVIAEKTFKYDNITGTWKKVVSDNINAIKISQQASTTPTDELWIGSLLEYNSLTTDPYTLYFIKED